MVFSLLVLLNEFYFSSSVFTLTFTDHFTLFLICLLLSPLGVTDVCLHFVNKQLTKSKQTSEYKWFLENHIIWMMKYGESETAGKNKQTDYLNIYKQPNITECSHFTFELDLFWIVCEVSLVLKRNLRHVFVLLHKSMKGAKKSRG